MADNFAAIKDEMECSLCFEQFVDPRVLDCQHTFCFTCIKQIKKGTMVPCPLCREETLLSGFNGVNNLRKNITMNNLLSITDSLSQSQKKAIKKECGPCGELECLTTYCRTCKMYACKNCSKAHQRMVQFQTHVLISREEADLECKGLVEKAKESVRDLRLKIDLQEHIQTEINHIDLHKAAVKDEIGRNFAEIINIIEYRKQYLIDGVDELFVEHEDSLKKQLADLTERKGYLDAVNSELENIENFEYDNNLLVKVAKANQVIDEYKSHQFLHTVEILLLRKFSENIVFVPEVVKSENFHFGRVFKKEKENEVPSVNFDEAHSIEQKLYKKKDDFKKRSKFIRYMRQTLEIGMQVKYVKQWEFGDPHLLVQGGIGNVTALAEKDGDWPVMISWGDEEYSEMCHYNDIEILG